jgi:transcriptional regulator of heat shock response
MGIIGPTRMRYPRHISLVRYCSKALDDLLSE